MHEIAFRYSDLIIRRWWGATKWGTHFKAASASPQISICCHIQDFDTSLSEWPRTYQSSLSIFQENEFQWVLKNEVPQAMLDLNMIMKECLNKFPMSLCGAHRPKEMETFILNSPSTTPTDQVRVVVTLSGDLISHADINLKLPRQVGGVGGPGGGTAGKDLYQVWFIIYINNKCMLLYFTLVTHKMESKK